MVQTDIDRVWIGEPRLLVGQDFILDAIGRHIRAAHHHAPHQLGVMGGEHERNDAAVAEADDINLRQGQSREQRGGIFHHACVRQRAR